MQDSVRRRSNAKNTHYRRIDFDDEALVLGANGVSGLGMFMT